jgi:acyl transferase domain-containing protein/acyl carrier protein
VLDGDEAIAVIGLSARVPGARDVEEFWLNLVRGRESVEQLAHERLLAAGVRPEALADPDYVRAAAPAPDAEYFDAALFGMTPREAAGCDPQIRLFLEAAHAAIENAGYDPATLDVGVGVFASSGPPFYAQQHLAADPGFADSATSGVMSLNHGGYVATTASYRLDLRGPSITVQTACSSTLVALHLACQSLRVGDCDVAVVGGADVEFPFGHGYRWSPGGVLSRTGHCRPFDAAADGTVFGSGACAVLVKRLSDALADGDHISAVIRGSAVDNDGADKVSFGAPSRSGQAAAVMEAMALAGVRPEEIGYVEAHGTGTALGDPIEVAALTDAYTRLAGGRLPAGGCALGSVKGNIGHLGPVAGLAGFIKTVLALEREQLPGTANFTAPNPRLNLAATPFRVQDRLGAWPREAGRPRRAGVGSIGIGGTNVHVVLEEAPVQERTPHAGEPRVLTWSGPGGSARDEVGERLADFLIRHGEDGFADAAATLQHGRGAHPARGAVVASSARDAVRALRAAAGAAPLVHGRADGTATPVSLLFPGQGSQQASMARGLYRAVPEFARVLDGWLDLLESPELPLRACWTGEQGLDIADTRFAQPLLFAVEVSIARLWETAGIRPAALLGHSIGELAAAAVAGIFEPEDAAALVLARARAMAAHPAEGGMLAVAGDEAAVAGLLHGTLTVAAVNDRREVVLSGSAAELAAAREQLAARRIAATPLSTSGAFHTPLLADAAAEFELAFGRVTAHAPRLPVFSAATGHPISAQEAADPAFWARQLVRPVRFGEALEALTRSGRGLLLEAGPGRALTRIAARQNAAREGRFHAVATLPRRAGEDRADLESMLNAAAHLWVAGHDVAWERLGQAPLRHRSPVPGYPYQRERHWVDRPAPTARPIVEAPAAAAVSPFSAPRWTVSPASEPASGQPASQEQQAEKGSAEIAVVLLPSEADSPSSSKVVSALRSRGLRVVPVRCAAAFTASDEEFGVRPGAEQDVRRLFEELGRRGLHPGLLVHALAAERWSQPSTKNAQEQLDRSFYSLLALARHGLHPDPAGRLPRLVVLTTGAVDVSGADPVEPVKASLLGAVRTLAAEVPWLTCRLIDLSPNTPEQELCDELSRSDETVLALRGRTRWIPREQPLTVSPSTATPGIGGPLRQDGVYVVTGGFGGLGLEMARALAESGTRPRIALLGRTVPPEGEQLATAAASGDARARRVLATLETAARCGAEIAFLRCDVGDVRQVRRALDVAAARLGPVNGVFHLAGVPGGGMLQVRRPEQAAEVLRPKVAGTLALAEALAGRPEPDFAVLFSSRAGLDGLVGSGDYAAANAVLDLFARGGVLRAGRVLSIDFPSWTKVGMAVATLGDAEDVGIDPAVGTDLVLRLLSARTPEQVAVRPFRDGRPVPLTRRQDPCAESGPVAAASSASASTAVSAPSASSAPAAPSVPSASDTARVPSADAGTGTDAGLDAAAVIDRLRPLWVHTLGTETIAADDDFFDLGGDSLAAVDLMARVRDDFGVELSIALLVETPTLGELADLLETKIGG